MKKKAKIITILFSGLALVIGLAISGGVLNNSFRFGEAEAASTLLKSYNFLDGGSSSNSAYTGTNLATNVSYAADNPGGTSGTTAWEADYANLSLTAGTRIGGKLVSAVQTNNTTAWANIKTTFTFSPIIEKVEILGTVTFGTAGNTTALYLQSSTTGTTWTTQSTTTSKSGTITFDSMTIPATSYLRFGIALTASSTNSGIAFTGIRVYQQDGVSKTLSSIAVTTQPTNKSYYNGDSFNPAGMVVTATYSDSSTANVTASCTYSPATLSEGVTEVVASYVEGGVTKTASITGITVAARSLTAISVGTNPSKMVYAIGESFDPTGMKITATFDAGSPNADYRNYTYSPTGALTTAGANTITIASSDDASKTTSLAVNVVVSSSISIVVADTGAGISGYQTVEFTKSGVGFKMVDIISTSGNIQFKSGSFSMHNTSVVPGNLTKITVNRANGTPTSMTLYTGTSSQATVTSGGTIAAYNSSTAGFSWDINAVSAFTYFRLYNFAGSGTLTFSSIVLEYAVLQEQVDAIAFGQTFLDQTSAGCSAQSAVQLGDVRDDLETAYSALSNDAKDYFVGVTPSESGNAAQHALARYIDIVTKYTSLSKFVVSSTGAPISFAPMLSEPASERGINNATLAAIIGLAGITILFGCYYVTKKRQAQ